jgi:hypothetical protein
LTINDLGLTIGAWNAHACVCMEVWRMC